MRWSAEGDDGKGGEGSAAGPSVSRLAQNLLLNAWFASHASRARRATGE